MMDGGWIYGWGNGWMDGWIDVCGRSFRTSGWLTNISVCGHERGPCGGLSSCSANFPRTKQEPEAHLSAMLAAESSSAVCLWPMKRRWYCCSAATENCGDARLDPLKPPDASKKFPVVEQQQSSSHPPLRPPGTITPRCPHLTFLWKRALVSLQHAGWGTWIKRFDWRIHSQCYGQCFENFVTIKRLGTSGPVCFVLFSVFCSLCPM